MQPFKKSIVKVFPLMSFQLTAQELIIFHICHRKAAAFPHSPFSSLSFPTVLFPEIFSRRLIRSCILDLSLLQRYGALTFIFNQKYLKTLMSKILLNIIAGHSHSSYRCLPLINNFERCKSFPPLLAYMHLYTHKMLKQQSKVPQDAGVLKGFPSHTKIRSAWLLRCCKGFCLFYRCVCQARM